MTRDEIEAIIRLVDAKVAANDERATLRHEAAAKDAEAALREMAEADALNVAYVENWHHAGSSIDFHDAAHRAMEPDPNGTGPFRKMVPRRKPLDD